MAATNNPKRQMSPAQEAQMLLREEVVLREKSRGKSFYRIERDHRGANHKDLDGKVCKCGGLHNPDRIWRRAINRDENASWRRAEAIRLEEQRLDELQEGIWDKALNGDARAVEVALKVLERRARMNGLDFADYLSGKMVEVEQAKVKLMAGALVKALQQTGATDEQRKAATRAFFAELRASNEAREEDGVHDITSLPPGRPTLNPEDEALL